MLKLLQKKLLAVNAISIVIVIFIAFSAVFVTFRAVVLSGADKAVTKALEEYTPARAAFLPQIPSEEDFDVTVEIYEKPPDDKNILFKTKKMPDGQLLVAKCNIAKEQKLLHRLLLTLCVAGGILSVFVFLISLSVSKRAIKPVEESIRIQEQFVADISHELKTPLTAINANLDLLNCDESHKRYLENIRFETERMIRLTKSMLKLFSEGNKTEFYVISLSDICERCVLSLEVAAFEKGLSLNSEIEENVYTVGNREQIEQLVSILADNAIKYNIEGGFVKITLQKSHHKALLCVENTGMPIKDTACVFRRFYRGDESRSREGFGLGLSIAQRIVTAHGGRISVKSGNTNVFSVNLGLKKAPNSDIMK